MVLLRAAGEADLPGILAIYNHEVANTTAIWNDTPVELAERQSWYQARRARSYPVLVADIDGQVAGYASFGDFRLFDGYRFTVEHSVYVSQRARRQACRRRSLSHRHRRDRRPSPRTAARDHFQTGCL
jgi:phosphinothricin acetyltransferase